MYDAPCSSTARSKVDPGRSPIEGITRFISFSRAVMRGGEKSSATAEPAGEFHDEQARRAVAAHLVRLSIG